MLLPCRRQVGIRLEILDWHQIQWGDELNDIHKMEIRIAAETWNKRDKFDIALTMVHFVQSVEGGKLPLGQPIHFFGGMSSLKSWIPLFSCMSYFIPLY